MPFRGFSAGTMKSTTIIVSISGKTGHSEKCFTKGKCAVTFELKWFCNNKIISLFYDLMKISWLGKLNNGYFVIKYVDDQKTNFILLKDYFKTYLWSYPHGDMHKLVYFVEGARPHFTRETIFANIGLSHYKEKMVSPPSHIHNRNSYIVETTSLSSIMKQPLDFVQWHQWKSSIYTLRLNEVERGVYWFHLVLLSVCPSVDRMVSALYLQQYSLDPFHIYISYQPTSGVSRIMFFCKIKKIEILANSLNL